MPLTDMPLEELHGYRPDVPEPDDFDTFWDTTLSAARAAGDVAGTEYRRVETPLTAVDVFDVRFPGWGGQPIAAWLLLPKGATQPLPAVVTYLGYSCGRGFPTEHLLWTATGYANLVVDSRGQGHDTPDPDAVPTSQWVEGFMTHGIDDPHDHYYRRLMTDCVRAVDVARAHPAIDAGRIVVQGGSQGGGLALATAGLAGDRIAGALVDVPFLCHYRRGTDIASAGPYVEVARYLGWHKREDPERAFATLNYFDGVHFAARATAPALFSVGLMDPVCPPSTVYAAYNRYAGDKEMTVWRFGDHAGGRASQPREQLRWLAGRGLAGQAA
jgi:cephalosporin-C deacetylase